jgi:hypothetical protein
MCAGNSLQSLPRVQDRKQVGNGYRSAGCTHAAVAIQLIHSAQAMHTGLTNMYGY